MASIELGFNRSTAGGSSTLLLVDCGVLAAGLMTANAESYWTLPCALFAARLGAVLGSLFNEWSHLVAGDGLVAREQLWNWRNLLGHAPIATHLHALVPFGVDHRGDLYVEVTSAPAKVVSRMRSAGFWLSGTLVLGSCFLLLRETLGTVWWWPALSLTLGGGLSVLSGYMTDISPRLPDSHHA